MHSFVELSDVHGNRYGQLVPLDADFSFNLNDEDSFTFDVSRDHRLASIAYLEPYATDFAWFVHDEVNDVNTCLMEGMVTAVAGEEESSFSVAGLSWEHYLNRRRYPFNPANPTQYFYAAVNKDVFTIVEDILETVQSLSDSLILNFDNGTSGILRNLRIEPGDTETVLEIVGQLAEQKPSFDFAIIPQTREFKMYNGKKGTDKSIRLAKGQNVSRIGFNDEGIEGNSVLVSGAGSSVKLVKLREDTQSMNKYRRLDFDKDYGDVIDQNYLTSLAEADIVRGIAKEYGLSVDVTPKYAEYVLLNLEIGDTVSVIGDIDYTNLTVDDKFRITGISGSMSRQRNFSVNLTFNDDSV